MQDAGQKQDIETTAIDSRKEAAILDDLREGKAGTINSRRPRRWRLDGSADQGESRPLGL